MRRPRPLSAFPLVLAAALLAPAGLAQFQDFSAWTGFDVGTTAEIRFPTEFELADLDGDGHLDLAVVSAPAMPRLAIRLGNGDGSFAAASFHPLANGASDLTAGDFDGDGDLDLAVAEGGGTMGNGNTVAIFRNDGDGGFALAQRTATVAGACGIAAGDFDGDLDLDLVVAGYGVVGTGTSLRRLVNDGTGTFLPGASRAVPMGPYAVDAGDLDGDGRADVVVGHEKTDQVSVVLSTGAQFAAPQVFDVHGQMAGGAHLFPCVALVDLDLDGDLDVAFSDNTHQKFQPLLRGIVTVVENLGGGAFSLGPDVVLRPGAGGFTDLAFADLNGDGYPDVLGVDRQDFDVSLSDGTGGFVTPSAVNYGFMATDEPIAIGAFDADHDGAVEALVLGSHSNAFSIHRIAAGTPVGPPATLGPSGDLEAADLDGDGDLDLVGGGTTIGVLKNQGNGTFLPQVTYPSVAFNGPSGVKLRDLNGDGRPDLLLGTLSGFNVRMNAGNGTFLANVSYTVPHCGLNDVDAVDLDQDGDLDVVLPEYTGCPSVPAPRVFVLENQGNGTFSNPTTFAAGSFTQRVDHADLNGDGRQDLVLAQNAWAAVLLSNGNRTFQPAIQVPMDFAPYGLAIADFDGDGALDVASANYGWLDDDGVEESMSVALGNGDGTFQPAHVYAGAPSWDLGSTREIEALDIDRDGDVDLAVVNYDSNDVSLYRNRGDGSFLPFLRVGGGKEPTDLVAGDFTGDGIPDLMIAASTGFLAPPSVLLLKGLGNDPWIDLGEGLPGTLGVPHLGVDGALVGGATLSLRLDKARPFAFAMHLIGFQPSFAPLFSGTLIPLPVLTVPVTPDAHGSSVLAGPLPLSLPGGFSVYLQTWILDPSSPSGYAAASNGVFASAP